MIFNKKLSIKDNEIINSAVIQVEKDLNLDIWLKEQHTENKKILKKHLMEYDKSVLVDIIIRMVENEH